MNEAPSLLEQISTRWPLISDPLQFVLRYAPAVRRYLGALIMDRNDVEDVTQDFLLRTLKQPFVAERLRSGRFRDYLKAALRNAALTHYRRTNRQHATAGELESVAARERAADDVWLAEWRDCLLRRAWEALEQHERQAPAGLAYTVLRLASDYPEADSAALAARLSAATGREVRSDAFRKQLSRARRRFAQLIVRDIQHTLAKADPRQIVEELAELGLMPFVRDFLPDSLRD